MDDLKVQGAIILVVITIVFAIWKCLPKRGPPKYALIPLEGERETDLVALLTGPAKCGKTSLLAQS